jgi:hypothetical protein
LNLVDEVLNLKLQDHQAARDLCLPFLLFCMVSEATHSVFGGFFEVLKVTLVGSSAAHAAAGLVNS